MAVHAIILSGGYGARLWPASRPWRPKPFIPLAGRASMFQDTVARMAAATGDQPPLIVAGRPHAEEIERQLRAQGGRRAILLVEPGPRDSGPAVAAAAAWIERHDPEGIGVMAASDHHLPDTAAFARAIASAVEIARDGAIVALGIKPSSASTAYGYIQPGAPLAGATAGRRIARFAEKPPPALADRYLAEGWLWNSGNFVFSARTLMEEMDRHAPAIAQAARAAVAGVDAICGRHDLSPEFLAAPKISLDYAVMEKTDRAAVAPLQCEWSDLGAWDAVHAASPQDGEGNAAPPSALLLDTRASLVRSSTAQTVAVVGLSNVCVIVEADAILVADLGASQKVKEIADRAASADQGGGGVASKP